MTKQLAFGKFGRPHALCQIGAAWPLFFTHNSFSFSAYSQLPTTKRLTLIGRPRTKEVPEEATAHQGKRLAARICPKALTLA
jgi:hypothetical protein